MEPKPLGFELRKTMGSEFSSKEENAMEPPNLSEPEFLEWFLSTGDLDPAEGEMSTVELPSTTVTGTRVTWLRMATAQLPRAQVGGIKVVRDQKTAEAHVTDVKVTFTHYDISKATHQPGDLGRGLLMHGRVLSAKDCIPLAGVKIIHWQAGEQGQYVDRLYAWRLTDDQGGYRFETEWPALRPPHIHFLGEAPGQRPLATQWISRERVRDAQFDLVLQPLAE